MYLWYLKRLHLSRDSPRISHKEHKGRKEHKEEGIREKGRGKREEGIVYEILAQGRKMR
jgi:hypothetical protein